MPLRQPDTRQIKTRLLTNNLLTTASALLLVLVVMLGYEYQAVRNDLSQELEVEASIIENHIAPALLSADPRAAEEVLASLRAAPSVVQAALLLPDGSLFASYSSRSAGQVAYHYAASGTGTNFALDGLTLYREITQHGKPLGKLFIEATPDRFYDSMKFFASAITLAVLAALTLSFSLLNWLSSAIVLPLSRLAELTRHVSHEKDYAVRSDIDSHDEIGDLARGFNNMLEQIQHRDTELEAEREERLKTIVDTMPVALFVKDSQSRFILMNTACEELFGTPFSLVKNTEWSQYYSLGQMESDLECNRLVFQNKKVIDVEEAIWNHARNEKRECRTITKPVFDAQGNPSYLIGVTIDITERKQAEVLVQRLTQLYKALIEVNQAIMRMEQQADMFPLACRCAVESGGMELAWIGQLDETSGLIIPVASYGDRKRYLEGIKVSSHSDVPEGRGPAGTALRENRSIFINDFFTNPMTVPWREQAANFGWNSVASFPIQRGGRPFAVLSVYHVQSDVFDGEAVALMEAMSKDISFALDNFDREVQRKAAEKALQLAASVYDTSNEAMMIADADNRIISINPAFTVITGYTLDEVVGKYPSILNSDRHDEAFYQAMSQEISTNGYWQGEIWYRRKNGEAYAMQLSINNIFNEDGSVDRQVSLFCDITERKQAEEAMRQAKETAEIALVRAMKAEHRIIDIGEETLQRVGQELHDDLGQHLTGTAFLAESLFQDLKKRGADEVQVASRVTSLLNEAVSHVRQLAHGLYPVGLKEAGLKAMLQHLARNVQSIYKIKCKFSGDKQWKVDDPDVTINLFRIAQEAISNAVKHGSATQIDLKLYRTTEAMVLEITDNGCGIGVLSEIPGKPGLGMHTMRYRASIMGATLQIIGKTGNHTGTSVVVNLPIQASLPIQ